MTLGILFIGLGLGLGMLIGFAAGAPDAAAGVGGAIVMLGAALVVNALVKARAVAPGAVLPRVPSTPHAPAVERMSEEREPAGVSGATRTDERDATRAGR
jgi:hypothetical protein